MGNASAAPIERARTAFAELRQRLDGWLAAWQREKNVDLAALNALLRQTGIPEIASSRE